MVSEPFEATLPACHPAVTNLRCHDTVQTVRKRRERIMRRYSLLAICVLTVVATSAFAADDGNTKWRINQGSLYSPSSSIDLISTTNGAGNVKGVRCNAPSQISVSVYVNGGSAETFVFDPNYFANNDSGWIPYNIRFTSSIRVAISRGAGSYGDNICAVSWGLD